jgi:phage shock protein PspC (stress-responsive transcriptional regulator)
VDLAPPPADAAPAPAPPSADGPAPPDRVIGGVAALLADRLDVDALWVRIAFVLLALVGGVGLVLYGALWLALVVGAEPGKRWARIAGGVALIGGLPLLLTQGFRFLDGPLAVLALLVGLAIALWQPRHGLRPAPSFPTPGPADDAPVGSPDVGPDTGPAARRRVRLPQRPARPPSILGRLTLGVAVVVAAVGALIDQADGGRLHPEQWLGAAAVVCGGGLLVGAFRGRARWLVVPAALFAGAGFVAGEAARVGVRPDALVGDEYVYVGEGSAGGRTEREHVVIGTVDVTIDGVPGEPLDVDARAAIGDVRVWVADGVTVDVRASADHGDIEVDGVRRDDGTFTIGPDGPADVTVVAAVGRGDVRVERIERARSTPSPVVDDGGEFVADGVLLTPGGQLVLGNGEAVIGADDTVLTGSTEPQGRVTIISTSSGLFQLLPGGLLLTPYGELLDLSVLRGDATDEVATTLVPDPPTTAAPVPMGPTIPGG